LITGQKTATIRKLWKKPLSPGDRLHCYWNLVSKERKKLFEATVTDVEVVKFGELVKNDSSSLPVQWYQNIRNREGSIYGYGAAFSFGVTENLSFGLSGMIIKGSTNDFESQLGRGRLVFYSSYFRVDSVDYQNTKNGTSDYSGAEINFSGLYKSGNNTVCFFPAK